MNSHEDSSVLGVTLWNPVSLLGSWFRVTLSHWGHNAHPRHPAPSEMPLLLRNAGKANTMGTSSTFPF